MSTFRDTLTKLFTRNVVIKRLPGKRLKALDVNKTQMTGPNTSTYKARWRRNSATGGYGYGYVNADIESLRKKMYVDYDLMDSDGVISSAIDIFADESTTCSENGELLVIKSENTEVKKLLHNLFYDILNIEFNLWSWIRTTCKYGDYFLFMDVREGLGVVNVVPVHPGLIVREEGHPDNPDRVRFTYEGDSSVYSNKDKLEAFEVAHFRLLTDPNYLPYGRSVIEPARKVYKSLQLMEDAMLLYRITRAPERRLFKIDVGNIAPDEIDAYIEEIANSMKKTPYYDAETGEYNWRYNIENQMEDYFLPTRGGESGTNIETLPGLQNQGQIDDINYLKDKMHAALKIPRSFLGGEESGENAKAGLAASDIRFARTIERIQKVFVSELYKIAVVHLYTQGFRDHELLNFEIYLTNPSLIYERQKIELLTSKMELVSSIKEANVFSDKYIYEVIFGMTEDEWISDRDQLIEDLKHRFRQQQITDEGNDPKVSNKTFGTPHDIASMHMASKMDIETGEEMKKLYKDDERQYNQGQPEKRTSFETERDKDFGRDPTGKKDMEKKAGLESFIRSLKKVEFKKLITEEEKPEKNIKMLDESSLIDGEI